MDTLPSILLWPYKALATWYVAALIGGGLILLMERRDRRREPSEAEVRYAAGLYRRYYGTKASRVVGDHMLGASFASDGRHYAFLKRVSAELVANRVTEDDRARAIEH